MVNYNLGKIYKIINNYNNLTYYGSTCGELRSRLCVHKSKAIGDLYNCTSKRLFNSEGDVKIYLVEKFPTDSKMVLHQRERYWIENNECVNKNIPCRSNKQYRFDNKDKIKQYRFDNKDKMKQYQLEYRTKMKLQKSLN